MTLQLLWEEYRAAQGDRAYRDSHFCERYRRFANSLKRSMRQVHRASDKLFVDYSGTKAEVIDAGTGENRMAEIFVAVLGASPQAQRPGRLRADRPEAADLLEVPLRSSATSSWSRRCSIA